jgi:hypothetical protein
MDLLFLVLQTIYYFAVGLLLINLDMCLLQFSCAYIHIYILYFIKIKCHIVSRILRPVECLGNRLLEVNLFCTCQKGG